MCFRLDTAASSRATSSLRLKTTGSVCGTRTALNLGHQLAPIERGVEEELQAGDRRVKRDRRGALLDQVQLEATQVLGARSVGRALKKDSELAYRTNIAGLRLGLELAHVHVLEHALTQRRDARSRSVHDAALLKNEADCLARQHRRANSATNHHDLPGAPTARAVSSPGRTAGPSRRAVHAQGQLNAALLT